jgi:uncharacterized coiled-coil protein SlyX
VSAPDDNEETRVQLHRRITDLEQQHSVDAKVIAHLEAEGVIDRSTIANLEAALITCRRIGAAMGIVMSTAKVTEDGAFDLLRQTSQRQHRKLREVAEKILRTGTLDDPE